MDANKDAGKSWLPRLTRRHVLGSSLMAAAATAVACGAKRKPARVPTAVSSSSSASKVKVRGGTFNWYVTGNPTGLDSDENARYWTQYAVSGVQSRLLQFKVGSDPKQYYEHLTEGDLAISVESPDAVTWTVKLRHDAKFHDVAPVNGHPVQAEDIKATFTRALTDPKNANRGVLGMIDPAQIQTPSADTVIFKLKYAYAWFQTLIASPTYSWTFPREVLAGAYDPNKQVIGSGPFLFESYTPDVALTYKRSPGWYEQGRPYVDGARIAIIPDVSQQLAQFTAGNLEVVAVPQNDLQTMKHNAPKATLLTLAPSGAPGFVFGQLGRTILGMAGYPGAPGGFAGNRPRCTGKSQSAAGRQRSTARASLVWQMGAETRGSASGHRPLVQTRSSRSQTTPAGCGPSRFSVQVHVHQ